MSYIIALAPLLLLFFFAYYFNNNKLDAMRFNIIITSVLEAILGYLIVLVLFLQGFISLFIIMPITIFLIPVLVYLIYFKDDYSDSDWDLQIETLKNILAVFSLTVLPFFVFLTVFRYLPFYFQFPLAIIVSAVIFFSSILVRELMSNTYDKIYTYISMVGAIKYVFLWIIIGILSITIALLDFPKNIVSDSLNLSNNSGYFSFDGLPVDIQNDFRQEEIMEIETDFLGSEVNDYYYDDTHLYLYSSSLKIIELSTKEIITNISLTPTGVTSNGIDSTDDRQLYSRFILFDNYLLFSGEYDIYLLTANSQTIISDFINYNFIHYYINDDLYFLNQTSDTTFNIYQFEEGEILLLETIDLSLTTYDDLLVLSETIFYEENGKYFLYEDTSISFDKIEGYPTYDSERQLMYYVSPNIFETIYYKVDNNNVTTSFSLKKEHNPFGIIIDGNIFFTEDLREEIGRIEIVNNDFEMDMIFNHLEHEPFWYGNKFYNSYIGNYTEKEGNLEFIQVEESSKRSVISIYQLNEMDVDLRLPFYTHYGIGIFISIAIVFFIPISNYRQFTKHVSFFDITSKKGS